jgi:hypothetical protein
MRYSAGMSEPPEEPLPKIPLQRDETTLIVVLVALVAGLWVGGTLLAHWIWDINWLVAALLVPAAVALVYSALKLVTRRKK